MYAIYIGDTTTEQFTVFETISSQVHDQFFEYFDKHQLKCFFLNELRLIEDEAINLGIPEIKDLREEIEKMLTVQDLEFLNTFDRACEKALASNSELIYIGNID